MNQKAEITEKTARLVKMLAEENLGGVLINSQPNFAWITGGANNGIDGSRENGAATLLIRQDGKRFVLASRIEMPRILTEEISAEDFEPVEFGWEDEKASPDFLAELGASLLNDKERLGADLPVGGQAQTIESKIAVCRYQLTGFEIERYRLLGRDAGKAIGELMKTLSPGESEKEVARMARFELAKHDINAVVTLVAADERLKKYRHPVPTEKKWEKTLMLVVCARRAGLIASLSRIICAGAIPQELEHRTQAAARVNAKILAATKPAATGAQIYETAARAYADEGFKGEQNLHHQGGATGYRTRDWVAHPASGEKVRMNQAFAWNPSITGTKVEETCIVSEDKIEIITASPDWAQIPVLLDGREYSFPGVLSI